MPRERHELPSDFPVCNLKPGDAGRRATVGPGYAAGIEKQHATAPFVARDVRVAVQENIDIIRRSIRRNVLQPELQPTSRKVENQRPLEIAVAISAHNDHGRSNRPQLIKNRFRTDVANMPDFIGIFGHFLHAIRQPIVRVGENKNAYTSFHNSAVMLSEAKHLCLFPSRRIGPNLNPRFAWLRMTL